MIKHSILCVDDEIDNVDSLERLFRKKYRVLKATSGREALDLLSAHHDIAVIISDQRMPQMTGVEFLRASMKTHPSTIRLLLTGYTDITSVIDAINSGEVYRYLTKPWDPVDLTNTIDKAVEKYELAAELKVKNQELEKALTELKTLDQAKTQFMVLINHELKTPLTTMLSFSELLKETPLDDDQKKYLSRVETSGLRLKEIVDDVMQLLSAETGLLALNEKKHELSQLLPQLPMVLQSEIDKKSLHLQTNLSADKVLTDKEVISNVVLRILHNAVKFSSPRSTIVLSSLVTSSGRIKVSIENEGESLSQAQIERILRPFTLNEDMMNHSRGMGLGLSLCQAVLKRCGSHLQIESERKKVKVSFELKKA